MRYVAKFLFLAAFLASCAFAVSEEESDASIKTNISRKRIFVGDRIRYTTEIVSGKDIEIEFPKFRDSAKIGDCEIKDSGSSVRRSVLGKHCYINWMDITSYYVGKRTVPSTEVRYRPVGKSGWRTLKTNELTFTVETILPKGAKITDVKDIKGILYPFSWLKFFLWVIAAFTAILVAVKLILKFIFKKAPPKLPHEIALGEIEDASKHFAAGGDVKDYYVRISDSVRRYIERVFALKASEMTTQEFLSSLSSPRIGAAQGGSPKLREAHKDLLIVFLQACDLVKFAKYKPARNDIEGVSNAAKKFIEESKEVYMKKETAA